MIAQTKANVCGKFQLSMSMNLDGEKPRGDHVR